MTNGSRHHDQPEKKANEQTSGKEEQAKKVTPRSLSQDMLTRGVQTPPPDAPKKS